MLRFLENLATSLWNKFLHRRAKGRAHATGGTTLGFLVADEQVTSQKVGVSVTRRTMHIAILGKTGSGKSSLLKQICLEDIRADRGFTFFDLHGDTTPFLLSAIAEEERRRQEDLSERVIVISPGDSAASVGLNPLEGKDPDFVHVAEFAQVLKQRWGLDHFGARTEELLRNALFVLSTNGLTLLELAPLLTLPGFRAKCLKQVPNAEVRQYFEIRYGQASDGMRAAMREPILNKTSAFTADPRFRHIVGQLQSTFSIVEAMDSDAWILVDLHKGKLGAHALTLASLLFTAVKNAIFARAKRSLHTIFADELQNFAAFDSDIETVLSEARKFSVSVVSANQFLDQYPASMRAAILSVGTHAIFQVSSTDAGTIAQMLDGGKPLAERLKNLSQRHFILKSSADRLVEVCVPTVQESKATYRDLLNRVRALRSRPRPEIEREIAERHARLMRTTDEVLHGWN